MFVHFPVLNAYTENVQRFKHIFYIYINIDTMRICLKACTQRDDYTC